MVWKLIDIDSPGNSTTYGGDDIKKINKYLSGYDLKLVDVSDVVDIATQTTFESEKFRILSPTTGFAYIFKSADIAADRTISLPLMTGNGEISLSAAGASNNWGAYMQTFRHQYIKIMNPLNTYGYIFNTSAITDNRNITLPLLTADDTLVTLNATQTLTNKTLTNPTIAAMTINVDSSTIKHSTTNNSGDLLVSNGAKFDRFSRGAASQVPIMNASGTGLEWIDSSALGGGGEGVVGDYLVPTVGNEMTGVWYGTTASAGSGCWNGFLTDVSTVTPTNIVDTSGRIGMNYQTTTDDAVGGFRTSSVYVTRARDPELWVRYKYIGNANDAEYRIAIGFVDDISIDFNYDNALGTFSTDGFLWYKDSADTDIHVARNGGHDTVQENDYGVSLAGTDESIHTIRLFGDNTNSRFGISLDGANASYFTTEIPLANTRIGCVVEFRNEDTNTRNFEIYGAYFKSTVV